MRKFAVLAITLAVVALPSSQAFAVGGLLGQLFNIGCTITHSPVHGCAFTNARGPIAAGELGQGNKEGEACGYNILALFTWGDVRISTAMKNGGITEISSVDSDVFELVPGFYGFSKYCTVVSGN